ncbi:SYT9 (predicted) [Pycnogonum litorale]
MNIQIVTVTVSSIVGVVAIVLTLLFMIKRFVRRRNMCNKLDAITPSDSKYGHKAVGLSYKQPIKFTLPAITVEPSDGSRAASSIPSESDTDRESTSTNVSIYSGGFVLPCGRQPSYGSYSISADEIDTELYLSESDEGHTSSSGATGLGRIGFSLQYTVIRQQLCVKVIGATGLPSNFIHKGSANPFVKLILHPEKSPKYLTKVHRNTTNPVFQEAFVFSAKLDGIEFRVLRISVWDYDKYSRKVPIGGVDVTLKDFGINSHLKDDLITEDVWKDLSSKETEKLKKGELFLSLSYKPEAATLTIGIIKAKNIEWPNTKGEKEHVYVKIRLLDGKRQIKSRKTPYMRRRTVPEFDYTFNQCIVQSCLSDVTIDFFVYVKSGFSGKQLVGRTQVGQHPDMMEQSVHHWTDMLDAPNSTVAQWHSIY